MKIIDENAAKDAAVIWNFEDDSNPKSIGMAYMNDFMKGASYAESLLLPKMVEFAEWIASNNAYHFSQREGRAVWLDNKTKYHTTAQLLDIWIEQTKSPSAE